jgi:DNA-binding SARP family transcriptional activator
MRYQLQILLSVLLCMVGKVDASSLYDYGLSLKSHSVPGIERTTLYLDDNQPFSIKNDFIISFQMYVRANEHDFGTILHLHTNTNQFIRFSFVAGEERHFPALVLNEGIININSPIEREKWLDVSLHLRLKDNVIEIDYDNKKISAMAPLQGVKSVTALFGQMKEYLSDVAPINLRNVTITQDGKQIREWKLWKHNDTVCYDEIEGAVARAIHPVWLIDNHIEWKLVHQAKIPGKLDVAFNAREALFYLVRSQSIDVLDENGTLQKEIAIRGGYPAVEFPNHLLYDTLSNKLVSYYPKKGITSRFSFDTERWSNEIRNTEEASNYNHARTFNPADSSFYFFGGYGFYQYRNDLYRMKYSTNQIEQVEYERPLYPRYSAAMAIVGDELYIFGGRGNKYGKQELSSHYYWGLCAINLKNKQSRIVWQKNQPQEEGTIMASTMYFEPSDSSFYAVSTNKGGVLWKISMKDSVYSEVSKPIYNESTYQDSDFSLYTSPSHGKLFLVLDKILSNHTHELAIYSINMPLVNEVDIRQSTAGESINNRWYLYAIGILLLLVLAGFVLYRFKYNGKNKKAPATKKGTEKTVATTGKVQSQSDVPESKTIPKKEWMQESETIFTETVNYYDRSRASISLLGCFNVRDKDGNDITSNFTPRLKHLLILLILYTEKNAQGILASKTTEILWPEKEETAARNNRNVNLRKLRVLLESIGDMEVMIENNFLRIKWGTGVFCDYHTLITCTKQFEQEKSEELLNRILELLLYGPLLPNTILDWLDDFKDDYSSYSIDLLKNLLDIEISRNHQDMIIRLADIMFLHDPLNEEALAAKCSVLVTQGKKGIARNLYDRFCKEYHDSMGETYKVPFADL